MNLKPYLTFARTGAFAVGVFAFVLFSSWIAGQCRQWRTPKPFPPLVDPGTPIAGPVAEAPTITESVPIARPDLSRAELEEAAKKYGLTLTTLAQEPKKPAAQPESSPEEIGPPTPAQTFPMLLAEETFIRSPTGPGVDVAAWLPGWGERVDLRARWREWTPPAAPAAKIPVCQTGGFLHNEAKWVKEIGAGVVLSDTGTGLGGWGSVAYRGPRTGAITWGARGTAAFSPQSGAVGFAGASVSW